MIKQLSIFLLFIISLALNAQVLSIKSRDHISLTDWSFKKGIIYNAQTIDFLDADWEKVKAPHTYSMDAINDIGYYRGEAWYRTTVQIPESMTNQRIFIRFEGVGQEARVFVNEKQVGRHSGGYSAFCFEITDAIIIDEANLIAVRVTNEPNFKRISVNDKLFNHYGGIYRPVHIFSTLQCNITPTYFASPGVFVELKESTKDAAKIEVRTQISNTSVHKEAALRYNIFDANKKLVIAKSTSINDLQNEQVISELIDIKNPTLWHGRKNPYLYKIEVELTSGKSTDKVSQSFGLRTFSVDKETGFILNNKSYRLYGVCMHQEWKQCGPALQPEHHQKDMRLIDEIGATSLRLSHYQHSDLTYQLADETGLLVWAEIPFVHDYSGREGGNAKHQLNELILQNYNHPSIFVWGLWNEVRAYKSPEEPCVILTKELQTLAHKLDNTRLTASASDRPIESHMANISDLQAWNKYFGWYYGEYEDMATWLDETHKKYPEIELGISEYGIGGNIFQQDVAKLEKPVGNYFPEPEQSKYHELTWKIIKDRPFVWASFVWNMFDFSVAGWNRGGIPNLNHKGLVTFGREIEKDAFYFYKANWSDEPVLYIAGRRNNVRSDENAEVKVYTNLPKVALFVNGKKIGEKKQKSDIHIITFGNVELAKVKNTIKVVSPRNVHVDEVIWTLKSD